jgi:hypothetical protein
MHLAFPVFDLWGSVCQHSLADTRGCRQDRLSTLMVSSRPPRSPWPPVLCPCVPSRASLAMSRTCLSTRPAPPLASAGTLTHTGAGECQCCKGGEGKVCTFCDGAEESVDSLAALCRCLNRDSACTRPLRPRVILSGIPRAQIIARLPSKYDSIAPEQCCHILIHSALCINMPPPYPIPEHAGIESLPPKTSPAMPHGIAPQCIRYAFNTKR